MITIRGNTRNLTVLLQGLLFKPDEMVFVVYISPVRDFPNVVYVLVLEKVTKNMPKEYKIVKLATLFDKGVKPGKFFFSFRKEKKKRIERVIRPLEEIRKCGN
jgi:hypothetical protein